MIFSYNDVDMQMVSLDRVHREMVYDPSRTDLLCIENIISASLLFSPNGWPHAIAVPGDQQKEYPIADPYAGNLRLPEGGPTNPVLAPGRFPLMQGETNQEGRGYLTDAELRSRLWQERGVLKIGWPNLDTVDAAAGWWLISPQPGRTVDAMNGPFPLALDVIDIAGDGVTFGVNFQIKTYTPVGPADLLILSHRWEMTHVHDDQNYLTRIIDGTIIFNGSELEAAGVEPDWFRNQFFHPIPLGFRRYLDPVTQSADGLTIRYRIRDVDQTVTFDPGDSGATYMEIAENVEYIMPWGAVALSGIGKGFGNSPWGRMLQSVGASPDVLGSIGALGAIQAFRMLRGN